MAKVKTLREDVFKKIAAGEVVERPLSVVKELVENAIDAGADSIKVELSEGGKRMIRVTDNGGGFDPDDIETAFKNHSTSKLSELTDFNTLNTLGFRGEALPSILEVSRIELESSNNDNGFGVRCVFEDGKLQRREEIASSRGTVIAVSDLFYNFPVRKKFLKTERTELNQITQFLEPLTLVNYNMSLELSHNGRTVFIYKKAENLKERIYQVFGKDFLDELQAVEFEYENYRLEGYISRLNTGVTVKRHQYFFVNGRSVKEKTLVASLNRTFEAYLEKHRYPVGILLLTIPPQEVDVNIHPMKLEIKFENSGNIFRFIKHGIESAFPGGDMLGTHLGFDNRPRRDGAPGEHFGRPIPTGGGGESRMPSMGRGDNTYTPPADGGGYAPGPGGGGYAAGREEQKPLNDFDQAQLFAGGFMNQDDFILIGQYKNSYIIIERNGELVIVDQHNAQERVNFDRLKKQHAENKVVSINPLFPVIIELTPSEAAKLNDEKMEMLERMGFRLESMGGNSYDVKSFPQVLGEKSVRDAVMEILHLPEDAVNFEDSVLAGVACKSAVKVNTKLYPDQMKEIVRNLYKSSNPYFCPHKRPIVIEFPLEQIEKMLKRK